MDRFSALRVFAQVVESGRLCPRGRAARALDHGGVAPGRRARSAPANAAPEPYDAAARADRERAGASTGARAAAADLEEAEQEASQGGDHAARHDAAHLLDHVRRAPRRAGDRRVRRPTSGREVRRRSSPTASSTWSRKGSTSRSASAATGTENLVARRLGETRLVTAARRRTYLARHGTPATPEDLARHNCFTYEYASPRNQWRFRAPDGREHDGARRRDGALQQRAT